MGLLDWLTSDLGGIGAGGGMGELPGPMMGGGGPPMTPEMPPAPPQGPPMPPPGVDPMGNQTGMDMPIGAPPPPAPPPPMAAGLPPGLNPMPPGGDPMAGTGSGNNGGLPPPMLPQPRPVEAAGPAALPPNAAPTGSSGMPPVPPMDRTRAQEIVQSYERAGGNAFAPPDNKPQAQTILGRALGLDGNRESQMRGSLGAGLKSVGENWNKPGLAAFAGSAGAGIEGGKKADDTTTSQQDKYLQRAIQAKKEGNNAEYQKNYLQYQIASAKEKLELAKQKQASGGGSVMNSPEQLYLRAIGATNQDGGLKILANKVREAQKLGPDSKEAKAAQAEYDTAFKQVRDQHLGTLGVDPSKIKGLERKPGFSDKTPFKEFPKDPAAAQKAFDALPDGAYFINPKDGRLLTKKSAGGAQGANPAQPQQQSAMTPPMPPIPSDPNDPLNQEAA